MDTTEQLKKMYSSRLSSQQEQLKQGYMQADAEYAAEKSKTSGTPGYTGHYNTATGGRYGTTGGAS